MGSTKAFLLRIRQGKIAEYKRRHAQIWPEMVEALEQLGYRH
ncbi:L-rhamnose mutarotase, partial [Staphylococcus aureus]